MLIVDIQEGVLLEGLRDLINSNTETMTTIINKIGDSFKKDTVSSTPSGQVYSNAVIQ